MNNKIIYIFLPVLLLLAAIVVLYGHSLWNPLVFDDLLFFVDANLERLGSSLFQLDLRWFSYASFGWTYKLFGHDWFWYRLGNLGLHALTGVLLFLFFSRLLDTTAPAQDAGIQSRWLAFFAALVFVLHPAAVYGVAYLVQRSILMATLFGIAALLCYLEGLSRDKAKWYAASALFYFLAVFSKEHSIMIPGVAAALTLLLHKPSLALIRRVWLPFALYLVIGVLIILRTKGVLGAAYEPQAASILAQLSEQQEDIHIANAYLMSVLTQGYLFFKYLLLWIVPYTGWMSIDIRQSFPTHFLSWPQLPGFILFLAYPLLAVKLLLKGGRQGLIGFGLLFPWILYLTELSTVRIQEPFVLYRSYLWMSGLPIVLFGFMGTVPRKLATILLAACCLVLAGLAWNRLDTFSDNVKIWADAIDKYQGDNLRFAERGYNNHGAANFELKNFQAALQSYDAAIELKPDFAAARNNRSTFFIQMGRYVDALNDCEYALQLDAQNTDAYLNCSLAHSRMGKPQEALRYLDDALRIGLQNARLYYNRGTVHGTMGRYQDAMQDYNEAIALNPNYADAYANRGGLYMIDKRLLQAMAELDHAIRLNPNQENAYINRGHIFALQSRYQDALVNYDQALKLNPNNSPVLQNRAEVLLALNRQKKAMGSKQ